MGLPQRFFSVTSFSVKELILSFSSSVAGASLRTV